MRRPDVIGAIRGCTARRGPSPPWVRRVAILVLATTSVGMILAGGPGALGRNRVVVDRQREERSGLDLVRRRLRVECGGGRVGLSRVTSAYHFRSHAGMTSSLEQWPLYNRMQMRRAVPLKPSPDFVPTTTALRQWQRCLGGCQQIKTVSSPAWQRYFGWTVTEETVALVLPGWVVWGAGSLMFGTIAYRSLRRWGLEQRERLPCFFVEPRDASPRLRPALR